jgi:hypothetical protein
MNTSRIAQNAAVAATIAWAAKSVAIGTAGGLGKSPLESPLFFVGLLCFVTAAVAYGASVTRARSGAVRVLAGIGVLVVGVGVVVVIQGTLSAMGLGGHWVWSELNLWVSAVLLLVLVHRLPSGAGQGVETVVRANEPSALRNP